jgi:hypothetical protein
MIICICFNEKKFFFSDFIISRSRSRSRPRIPCSLGLGVGLGRDNKTALGRTLVVFIQRTPGTRSSVHLVGLARRTDGRWGGKVLEW